MSKKVIITSEFFGRYSNEAEKILKSNGFEVIPNPYDKFLNEDEIISIIGEADAIICDLEGITKKVIDNAPNLKVISRRGVGIDSVDIEYAKEKGIKIKRTLGVVERPVAELVMAYILQIYRNISESNEEMKNNRWVKLLGRSTEGKVMGIVGLGNIGIEVARKAKAFDMEVIYSGTRKHEKEKKLGLEYATFEELLEKSDIISIHVSLSDSTRDMFNYDVMKQMKKQPILINTARGPIVNEKDLKKALNNGLVSYAAIDVYDKEPKTDSTLVNCDNALLTPHNGTFTKEVFIKMDILAAKNIIETLC
ncbi:MAG: phosphoglycerate dehydrogenase [Lutispora sp.]|nr:phosphoglycerate dehydrogenase [Lutispora sp.]